MITVCRCKWCGTLRRWSCDAGDPIVPLDAPIYCCADGPTGYCEPSSGGERMVRELAIGARRRRVGA